MVEAKAVVTQALNANTITAVNATIKDLNIENANVNIKNIAEKNASIIDFIMVILSSPYGLMKFLNIMQFGIF